MKICTKVRTFDIDGWEIFLAIWIAFDCHGATARSPTTLNRSSRKSVFFWRQFTANIAARESGSVAVPIWIKEKYLLYL